MKGALITDRAESEQDRRISEVIEREQPRLRNFIRKRVADQLDVDDILQDVFYELVEAYRLMKPIERVGSWLFRVAQNRITDVFRKKKPERFADQIFIAKDGHLLSFEELLPSAEAGPDAVYARTIMLDELEDALDELPDQQRRVFIAHELEGRSFKDIAAETGLSVNTLLSRKRAAVLHLRRRLRAIYKDFTKN
jgi:RNA polymerase sigma factor (sigma-70 family)